MLTTHWMTTRAGKRVRMARVGHGPPLVVLHGYPENLQIASELAPLLANQFEVISFDWPGQGMSEAWPGGATPELLAGRLRILFEEWGLARVSLLGMDMGGQPALVFAARYPERIDRLIVMNSLVFGDGPTSWEIRLLRRFGWNRFILRHLPRLVFFRAEQTFLPRGFRLPEALRRDFWEAFCRPEVRQFLSKMCAGYQGALPTLPELYSQIRCPTLIVWGDQDRHFPLEQAHRLQQAIPHAQLTVLKNGQHWMVLNQAEDVAQAIQQFYGSLTPKG